ncbi:MAG: outer membrane beta-barrel protein [Rhodospirillales bacterium]|nr:outer membrane beta-barrel protein [Rhodospirillales bacterium]
MRGETVLSRVRPEYDPLGVRLGSFYLFPRLDIYQSFNDNVFASENDEDSDFIANIVPGLALQSDWGRHAVNLSAGSNTAKYYEFTRQDYTEYFVNGNGRLDISGDSALFGGAGYARQFILPGTPDALADVREPTAYDIINGFARYFKTFGRLRTTVDGSVDRFTYDDDELVNGESRSNADDDRTIFGGAVRAGYELIPRYEAFVRGSGNRRYYDDHDGVGTPDRSSTGYSAVTGVAMDFGGIIFGEIYAGYLQQIYDSSEFDNIGGLDAGGSLTWNVTTLTTVSARVARQINDSIIEDVTGIFSTEAGLDVDHELLRNLILNGNFSFVNDDYEGISRNDDYYIGGLGARYLITRNFAANLGYRFVNRNSSRADLDYKRNIVRIGLQSQL